MKDRLRYFREQPSTGGSYCSARGASRLSRDAPDIGDNSIFLPGEMGRGGREERRGGEGVERICREYYPTQDWRNVITLSKHSFEGVPCPLMAQSFNGFQIGPLRLLRIPRKGAHAAINHAD